MIEITTYKDKHGNYSEIEIQRTETKFPDHIEQQKFQQAEKKLIQAINGSFTRDMLNPGGPQETLINIAMDIKSVPVLCELIPQTNVINGFRASEATDLLLEIYKKQDIPLIKSVIHKLTKNPLSKRARGGGEYFSNFNSQIIFKILKELKDVNLILKYFNKIKLFSSESVEIATLVTNLKTEKNEKSINAFMFQLIQTDNKRLRLLAMKFLGAEKIVEILNNNCNYLDVESNRSIIHKVFFRNPYAKYNLKEYFEYEVILHIHEITTDMNQFLVETLLERIINNPTRSFKILEVANNALKSITANSKVSA